MTAIWLVHVTFSLWLKMYVTAIFLSYTRSVILRNWRMVRPLAIMANVKWSWRKFHKIWNLLFILVFQLFSLVKTNFPWNYFLWQIHIKKKISRKKFKTNSHLKKISLKKKLWQIHIKKFYWNNFTLIKKIFNEKICDKFTLKFPGMVFHKMPGLMQLLSTPILHGLSLSNFLLWALTTPVQV